MELIADSNPERGVSLDLAITEEEVQEIVELFRKSKPSKEPLKLSDLPTRIQNQLRDVIKESEIFKDPLQEELKKLFSI